MTTRSPRRDRDRAALLLVALLVNACERSASLGLYQESASAGASVTAAETSAATTHEIGESSGGQSAGNDDPAGSGGARSSTGSGLTESASESGQAEPTTDVGTTDASTTDAPDPCAPDDDDDGCELCVKGSCCAPLSACGLDPLCVCMTSCLEGGSAPQLCVSLCMPGPVYSAYIACLASQCATACAP